MANKCFHSSLFVFILDGGVARLRVHGEVVPDWSIVSEEERLDLVAMVNGRVSAEYTDAHYGHARNVIAPGRARRMDEGMCGLPKLPYTAFHIL